VVVYLFSIFAELTVIFIIVKKSLKYTSLLYKVLAMKIKNS
jgi:hypothetical protein